MTASKGKRILQLALPLIFQQLCLQLQVWIDRAMLGHINVDYFSAIGNTTVPYHMITSAITALCGGATILIAQKIGAKDIRGAQEVAESSFLGSTIICTAVYFAFFIGSEQLFRLMGVQSPILEYCVEYFRILSLSLLILGPSATASSILQGVGFTKVIMMAGITGNLLNILLDWILIFGKFGFPEMGIRGAALATVLADAVAATLTILYVSNSSRMAFRVRFRNMISGNLRCYKRVLEVGIPSGLELGIWNVGMVVLVSFLNRLDIISAGIYTLVFSVETIPRLVYMGFANAGLTLVGQETGARSLRQVRQTGMMCLVFSFVVCLAVVAVFLSIPEKLLGFFTDDAEMLRVSVPYLTLVSYYLFPKTINSVIGRCIRAMGDTRWMLYTQLFGIVFMIACGYYLILCTSFGLSGIFITLLLDEAIRGVVNLLHFFSICRKENAN